MDGNKTVKIASTLSNSLIVLKNGKLTDEIWVKYIKEFEKGGERELSPFEQYISNLAREVEQNALSSSKYDSILCQLQPLVLTYCSQHLQSACKASDDERISTLDNPIHSSQSKHFIQNKKLYLLIVTFLSTWLKLVQTHNQAFLTIDGPLKDAMIFLVLGMEDIIRNQFMNSDDADYEIIIKLSMDIVSIIVNRPQNDLSLADPVDASRSSSKWIKGPILAQIIQIVLSLSKSMIKNLSLDAISLLYSLLINVKSIDEWRQYFPGVCSGLYALINASNQISVIQNVKQFYLIVLSLFQLIYNVSYDEDPSNRMLLREIHRETAEDKKDIHAARLSIQSILQQYQKPHDQTIKKDIRPEKPLKNDDEIKQNLPSLFQSLDAFIQWRVDLLQRLNSLLPKIARAVLKIDQNDSILKPITFQHQMISVIAKLLSDCLLFLGSQSSLVHELIDLLLYYCDHSNETMRSLAVDSFNQIGLYQQHKRISVHYIKAYRLVQQQLSVRMANKLQPIKKYEEKASNSEELLANCHRILGFSHIAHDEMISILQSFDVKSIKSSVLPLFVGMFQDHSNRFARKLSHDDLIEDCFYSDQQFYSFKDEKDGLWLSYPRLHQNCTKEEGKALRRLCILFGRYGLLSRLIDTQRHILRLVIDSENDVKRGCQSLQYLQQSMDLFEDRSIGLFPCHEENLSNEEWRSNCIQQERNQQIDREASLVYNLKQHAAISTIISYAMLGLVESKQKAPLKAYESALNKTNDEDHTQMQMIEKQRCNYCDKAPSDSLTKELDRRTALSRCSQCKSVWYCSIDHQKKDWSKHKTQCRPIKTIKAMPSSSNPSQSNAVKPSNELKDWICDSSEVLSHYDPSTDMNQVQSTHINRLNDILAMALNSIEVFFNHSYDADGLLSQGSRSLDERILRYQIVSNSIEQIGHATMILKKDRQHDRLFNKAIYLLLQTVVSRSNMASQAARSTIHRWRGYFGMKSISQMLSIYLSSIVDHVSLAFRLRIHSQSKSSPRDDENDRDASTRASIVLQLVLDTIASDYESNKQESNAMALQIIRDMIQTTIESCDSLATIQFLSQSQVVALLKVMKALVIRSTRINGQILETLLSQLNPVSSSLKALLSPYPRHGLAKLFDLSIKSSNTSNLIPENESQSEVQAVSEAPSNPMPSIAFMEISAGSELNPDESMALKNTIEMDLSMLSLMQFDETISQLFHSSNRPHNKASIATQASDIYRQMNQETSPNDSDEEDDDSEIDPMLSNPSQKHPSHGKHFAASKEIRSILSTIIHRCGYFLSLPILSCQVLALETMILCYLRFIRYSYRQSDIRDKSDGFSLSSDQKHLYPIIHQSWPSLVSRLKDMRRLYRSTSSGSSSTRATALLDTQNRITMTRSMDDDTVSIQKLMNERILLKRLDKSTEESDRLEVMMKENKDIDSGSLLLLPSLMDMFSLLSALGKDFLSTKFKEDLWPELRLILLKMTLDRNKMNQSPSKTSSRPVSLTAITRQDLFIVSSSSDSTPSMKGPHPSSPVKSLRDDSTMNSSKDIKSSMNNKMKISLLRYFLSLFHQEISIESLQEVLVEVIWFVLPLLSVQSEIDDVWMLAVRCLVRSYHLNPSYTLTLLQTIINIHHEIAQKQTIKCYSSLARQSLSIHDVPSFVDWKELISHPKTHPEYQRHSDKILSNIIDDETLIACVEIILLSNQSKSLLAVHESKYKMIRKYLKVHEMVLEELKYDGNKIDGNTIDSRWMKALKYRSGR